MTYQPDLRYRRPDDRYKGVADHVLAGMIEGICEVDWEDVPQDLQDSLRDWANEFFERTYPDVIEGEAQ